MRWPVSNSRRPTRRALRGAAIAAPLLALLLVPTAALADDGPGHAKPLGVANSLLIFLVAPVGVFLLVAVITLRPGSAPKAQRYRPGKDWTASPAWTGVQPEPTADAPALESGTPHVPVMDGAPDQVHASSADDATEAEPTEAPAATTSTDETSGGSRGSW